jgi:hypothetical protein
LSGDTWTIRLSEAALQILEESKETKARANTKDKWLAARHLVGAILAKVNREGETANTDLLDAGFRLVPVANALRVHLEYFGERDGTKYLRNWYKLLYLRQPPPFLRLLTLLRQSRLHVHDCGL